MTTAGLAGLPLLGRTAMPDYLAPRPPDTVRTTTVWANGGFAVTVIGIGPMTSDQALCAATQAAPAIESVVRSLWTQR